MAHKTGTQTPVIYNAVYNAMIAAQLAASSPVALASATVAQQTAADEVASAVDTLQGVIASLASAASVTQPPGTAAQANALATIPQAAFMIAYSLCFQRYNTDANSGDNSTLVNGISAALTSLMSTNCIT